MLQLGSLLRVSLMLLLLLLVGCGTTEAVKGIQGAPGPTGPPGLVFTGPYSAKTSYSATELATFQGTSYAALRPSLDVTPVGQPSSAQDWAVLAQAGEAGPVGAQGTQGATGPQGNTGAQGVAGPPGATGPEGPSGTQGATGPAGPPGPAGPQGASQTSFLQGRRFSVQGDSISALLGNGWQDVVIARTGMTLQTQDARGGRTFPTALECWGDPRPGNPPGNFDASYPVNQGPCGKIDIGIADETPFAQSLANVDVLLIDLGSNDQGETIGTLGDATNSGTYYGNMRWVVEAYLTAKPTLRIVLITNQYLGYSPTKSGLFAAATVAYGNSMGIPVLNMFQMGGVNSLTMSSLTPDGVHPNHFDLTTIYGPTIAQFVQSIF